MGHEIVENNECRNIRGLVIKGSDLAVLGFKGSEIGSLLHEILGHVIDGNLNNDKAEIMEYAEQRCSI